MSKEKKELGVCAGNPVYIGLAKFYTYPVDFACKPNHKVCEHCGCFGGYIDENYFLCSQYWQKKVITTN